MDSGDDILIPCEKTTALHVAEKSSANVVLRSPISIICKFNVPQDVKIALDPKKYQSMLVTEAAKDYKEIIPCLAEFKDIKPKHYWFLMKLLLYMEHYQGIIDMEQYSLYKQKIVLSKFREHHFVIRVPGLTEERPSVRAKDTVTIVDESNNNRYMTLVTFVGKDYVIVQGTILLLKEFRPSTQYNIHFSYPDHVIGCLYSAVNRVYIFNLLPMLFPHSRPSKNIQKNENLQWFNKNIASNTEQQQAIIHILAKTAFPAPYILFGPPGTGKTSTIVEAISQILKRNPSNRILVCTPSNAAADEIAQRLLKNAIDARDIHRMYSLSRNRNTVDEILRDCSNITEGRNIFVSKEILITKKIVITTLINCHRLIYYNLRANHFSYVFVDEAGQATEPETLIPMTLLSNEKDSHKGRFHGQVVICGDPQQLGPIISSKIAEPLLGRSMLERLMEWKLYRKNEQNKFNPSYVTKLIDNYRCHEAILHVPNKLFYEDELVAQGGQHTERALDWYRLPKTNFPVIFHATNGKEAREPHSPSVYNSDEISVVMSYVNDLLGSKLGGRVITEDEIGIVTPYKLQKQKICDELSKKKLDRICVGTVEMFQGQERDVIIMTTVRSALYTHNGRIHVGFLSNPKRFNVAITRAKALLIVVGNPTILQIDDYWRYFILYCIENGACRGSQILKNRCLSHAKIQELLARKHVPIALSEPDKDSEIVEEAPMEEMTIKLPKKNPARRRRQPRNKNKTKVKDDEQNWFSQNDISIDYSLISDLFNPCNLASIGSDYSNDVDLDEFDMRNYFAKNSQDDSEATSVPFDETIDIEDSCSSCSSPWIDSSDKSPDSDSNQDKNDKMSVTDLATLFPNSQISTDNSRF